MTYKKSSKYLIIIAASLLFSTNLEGRESFTLSRAVELYNKRNIALQIQRLEMDKAQSLRKIARAWDNPIIRFLQEGINIGTRQAPAQGREFQLFFEKSISLGVEKRFRVKKAESEIQIASDQFKRIYWDGLSYIKKLYSGIQILNENLAILKKTQQRLDRVLEIIRERYSQGDVSSIDLSRIELVIKDMELEQSKIENVLLEKKRTLLVMLDHGGDPDSVEFSEPFTWYTFKEEKALLMDIMSKNNPHLRQLANLQRQREIDLSIEKSKNIPKFTAAAGYKKENTYDTYVFSLALNIPVFNQRKGEIEIARYNIDANKLRQKYLRKELIEAFELEYQQYTKANLLIRVFKERFLVHADKLEETTIAAYEGGEAIILVLVDSFQSAYRTRLEFLELILQNNAAVFNIEKLSSMDLDMEKKR